MVEVNKYLKNIIKLYGNYVIVPYNVIVIEFELKLN